MWGPRFFAKKAGDFEIRDEMLGYFDPNNAVDVDEFIHVRVILAEHCVCPFSLRGRLNIRFLLLHRAARSAPSEGSARVPRSLREVLRRQR